MPCSCAREAREVWSQCRARLRYWKGRAEWGKGASLRLQKTYRGSGGCYGLKAELCARLPSLSYCGTADNRKYRIPALHPGVCQEPQCDCGEIRLKASDGVRQGRFSPVEEDLPRIRRIERIKGGTLRETAVYVVLWHGG